MVSGDEFYGDDETSGFVPVDWRAYADDARKARHETFACEGCGSPEPARIALDGMSCSDCNAKEPTDAR